MSYSSENQVQATPRSRWLVGLRVFTVTALLAVHFALALSSAFVKSPTSDEPFHLARGVAALFSGDFRLNVAHPPLVNILSAVPLVAIPELNIPFQDLSWRNAKADLSYRKSRFARLFLWRLNRDPQRIIILARIPIMILSVLLGLLVFFWARTLYGSNAALFSLFIYCLCPNILAHARLITTDIGAALLMTAAVFCLRRYLRRQAWRTLLLAALALGIAQLSKFTAVFLYPVFLLLLFLVPPVSGIKRFRAFFQMAGLREGKPGGCWSFIIMAVISVFIIWAGYGFETRSEHSFENLSLEKDNPTIAWRIKKAGIKIMADIPVPPRTYYYGLARTMVNTEEHYHPLYFMGELSTRGWWYYYPVLFLIKVPLALLVLVLIRILAFRLYPEKQRQEEFLLLIPLVLIFIFFVLFNRMNIGIRHLLPMFPFLYIWLGRLAVVRVRRKRLFMAGVGLLMALYAAGSFSVHPDYLVYFNRAVGGPEGGLRYSVLGEDWGQDIAGLGRYVKDHRIPFIYYTPYGNTDPRAYGINYSRIECNDPRPGIFALHRAEQVRPLASRPDDCYAWLDKFDPVYTIGHTIRIYQIRPSDLSYK